MARYTTDNPYTGNKLLVIACAGQSNSVGYGESFSYTVPSNEGLYQLGLYGADNLQAIPLTTTPQNYQNLSNITSDSKYPRAVTKSSKVSYHLQLAYRLREAMLQNYDVMIVPVAYGMTGFTNNTTDTFDALNLTCTNTSKQFSWKAGLVFSKILVERIKYAMNLHPENVLGGIVWFQGETDAGSAANVANHIVEFEKLVNYVSTELYDYKERSIMKAVDKSMWYTPNSTIYWYKSPQNFGGIYKNYQTYLGIDNLIPIPFDENYTNANGGDGETSSARNSHYRDMVVVGNAMADHLIKDAKFELPFRVLPEVQNVATDISSYVAENYPSSYTRLSINAAGELYSNPHATTSQQQTIWFRDSVKKVVLDNTVATKPFYLLFKDADSQEYAVLIDDTANVEGHFWKVYKKVGETLTEVGNTKDNNFKNIFSVLRYSTGKYTNFNATRQAVYGITTNEAGNLLIINGTETTTKIATRAEDMPFSLGNVESDRMTIYVASRQDEKILSQLEDVMAVSSEAKTVGETAKQLSEQANTDLATLKTEVNQAQTLVATELALKANQVEVYTKTEVDEKLANVNPTVDLTDYYTKTEVYNKTEVDNKIANIKVDGGTVDGGTVDLTNYYNKTEVDEKIALKADQTALSTVINSVQATSNEFQGQLATMKTELTNASTTMTNSLTEMNGKITTLSTDVDTRIDTLTTSVQGVQTTINEKIETLTTNVQAVQKTLNDTDTQFRIDIDNINSKIPNTASATNQLADKDYVIEQVQSNAARGISASATGDTFASYDALTAGPWYYQGTAINAPHQNDYAVVSQDANNNNKTVRYNYDGTVWIKFMVYDTSGGAGFTPTTSQTAAMNSGITSTQVTQIATNKTDIATEKTARETGDTDLLAKITAEVTARETGDTGLLAKIAGETSNRENAITTVTDRVAAEELARANGDTNVLSKVTDEQNARIAADNKLTQDVASNATDISNANVKITALETRAGTIETSIGNKANTADVYTKEETDVVLTNQYATQFNTLTTTLTTKITALEEKVAQISNLTAHTVYLNWSTNNLIFAAGQTKTQDITNTNIAAANIVWEHDQTDANNTMTDKTYADSISFSDITGGIRLSYTYSGGNGRAAIKLTYKPTNTVIGTIYIATGAAINRNVDIAWTHTIYA